LRFHLAFDRVAAHQQLSQHKPAPRAFPGRFSRQFPGLTPLRNVPFPDFLPDPQTRAAALLAGGLACSALAHADANVNPNDKVIVLDSGEAQLSLIDEASRTVVGTEPTGKEPHHLMITPDGQSLIVADSVSNDLLFLDPHSGKVQRRVEGIEDPYQLGFSPDHKWFVTAGLRLDRVDIYSYNGHDVTLVKRIPLAKTPSHITFASDNKTAFVTLQDTGEVAAIDLPTQTVLWKLHIGNTPAGLWMTPGDSTCWSA
jgi:DNA-binding beta-propeller fold protein YncE